ncbi:MAG: SDR family oxidoreductase, partial [Chloroflexota bacterium]
GQTCALYLDQCGFWVFAGVRRQEDAEKLQQAGSNRLKPIVIDVTQADTIASAVTELSEQVADSGLDGLINNAGIAIGGPLEFLPIQNLQQQLEVNVVGQIAVTQAFLPLLRKAQGRIINMSSVSGRIAFPFFGPYCASKFALEALTDSLRLEVQPWGIEVISLQPGSIATPIWRKSLARADKMLDQLPPQGHELYDERLSALRRMIEKTGEEGIPPEEVASIVMHALTTRRPKTRYVIGRAAKRGVFLARWLPDRLRDSLILRLGRR